MILVTGAAGKTGRAVLRRLAERGARSRALVHRHRHRSPVEAAGAREIAVGDLRDETSLAPALSGVSAVYHVCPNVHPEEVEIGARVARAAEDAKVKRFVFHSVLRPQIESMPHHWAKLRVEELLFRSRLEVSVLQPAPYFQNIGGQLRAVRGDGVYSVPYAPTTRLAMVDVEDVAEVAATVLCEDGHGGATYELCGRELLDQNEVAAGLSRALGRPVRAEKLPMGTFVESARAAGREEYAIDTLVAMFRYYERHGLAGGHRVLEQLLGRPATRFSEYLERACGGRE